MALAADTPLVETPTPDGPIVYLPDSAPTQVRQPVEEPAAMAQPYGDPRLAPYAGHHGHAQQVPSFRWGWFGAEHFYPQVHWHQDYNGETIRWSRQRRY